MTKYRTSDKVLVKKVLNGMEDEIAERVAVELRKKRRENFLGWFVGAPLWIFIFVALATGLYHMLYNLLLWLGVPT